MATAEQTVGAVLDATNKRYLVEHTEGTNDNGTWWADRYSDGWVEQGGKASPDDSRVITNVVFPIPFRDKDYYRNFVGGNRTGTNPFNDAYLHATMEETEQGFKARDYMTTDGTGLYIIWEAKGFAA